MFFVSIPESVKDNHSIILFDGVCNLCSGFMHFVYKRDRLGIFRFAWLHDESGREILDWLQLPKESFKTIILIKDGIVYSKSTSFLKIVRYLHFPWPLLSVGYIMPRSIRDRIYDWVAANRYRWFGKKDQCLMPLGDLNKRFL